MLIVGLIVAAYAVAAVLTSRTGTRTLTAMLVTNLKIKALIVRSDGAEALSSWANALALVAMTINTGVTTMAAVIVVD